MAHNYSIIVASGHSFDFANPTPEMIDGRALACHLAHECRWAGNTWFHYSVAQHSILVAKAIPNLKWRIYGLLHDAAEAYTRDLPTPFKEWLVMQGVDVIALERRILNCVYKHFDLPRPTAEIANAVDLADAQRITPEQSAAVEEKWLSYLDTCLFNARQTA